MSLFGLSHSKWTQAAKDGQAPPHPCPFPENFEFCSPDASTGAGRPIKISTSRPRHLKTDQTPAAACNLPFMHASTSLRFHNLRRPCRGCGTYSTLIHGEFATYLLLKRCFRFSKFEFQNMCVPGEVTAFRTAVNNFPMRKLRVDSSSS